MRFFNVALMLPSQRLHSKAAIYDLSRQHNGSTSTSGRFKVGPATLGDGKMREMDNQQLPSMKPVSLGGAAIADAGKVRFGALAPSLPPVRLSAEVTADAGKVRFGALAPSLPPVRLSADATADAGKVRFGALSPSLPR